VTESVQNEGGFYRNGIVSFTVEGKCEMALLFNFFCCYCFSCNCYNITVFIQSLCSASHGTDDLRIVGQFLKATTDFTLPPSVNKPSGALPTLLSTGYRAFFLQA